MNRKNTQADNYTKQVEVGLAANNMSLYSDTIFTDREPTTDKKINDDNNGRRSSTKMQDRDDERQQQSQHNQYEKSKTYT